MVGLGVNKKTAPRPQGNQPRLYQASISAQAKQTGALVRPREKGKQRIAAQIPYRMSLASAPSVPAAAAAAVAAAPETSAAPAADTVAAQQAESGPSAGPSTTTTTTKKPSGGPVRSGKRPRKQRQAISCTECRHRKLK